MNNGLNKTPYYLEKEQVNNNTILHLINSLSKKPNDINILYNLSLLTFETNDYKKAIFYIQKAIAIMPENAIFHHHMGTILFKQSKFNQSIESCKKAINLNPNYSDAYGIKGLSYEKLGKDDDAILCYKKIIDINHKDYVAYYSIGRVLHNSKNNIEAIQYFRKAISYKKDFYQAYSNIAAAFYEINKIEDAVANYNKCFDINPNDPNILIKLCIIYQENNLLDEAVNCIENILKILGDNSSYDADINKKIKQLKQNCEFFFQKTNALIVNIYEQIGIILRKLSLYKESVTVFENLLKLNFSCPQTYSFIQLYLSKKALINSDKHKKNCRLDNSYESNSILHKFITLTHKAASMYIFFILKKICLQSNILIIDHNEISIFNKKQTENERVSADDIFTTNCFKNKMYFGGRGGPYLVELFKKNLKFYKGIFIVRDPRDLIISRYFSAKYSHNPYTVDIKEKRKVLDKLSINDGISLTIQDFEKTTAQYVFLWLKYYKDKNIKILKYEDLVENSQNFFLNIIDHLELNVSVDLVKKIVQNNSFQSLTDRKRGTEDISSHLRKGVVGDWKNHFNSDHLSLIYSLPYCKKILSGYGYLK